MKPGNKDWQGKGCMILMLIGEIVAAIFIICMLVRWLPVFYVWTQPVFQWIGEMIKRL